MDIQTKNKCTCNLLFKLGYKNIKHTKKCRYGVYNENSGKVINIDKKKICAIIKA